MTDERYVFASDLKEKKQTARSAHNKRTHCGKGGSVRLPSDYMTRKELNAMSGEVKSYRMNEPIKWAEFKSMPDDLKVQYIKLIRESFGAPATEMCRMLGVSIGTLKKEIARLGLKAGQGVFDRHWNKEGFYAWAFGEEKQAENEDREVETRLDGETLCVRIIPTLCPSSGVITYEGNACEALEEAKSIFNGEPVVLTISWNKCPEKNKEGTV